MKGINEQLLISYYDTIDARTMILKNLFRHINNVFRHINNETQWLYQVLSRSLPKSFHDGSIGHFHLGRGVRSVSHLLFANDAA